VDENDAIQARVIGGDRRETNSPGYKPAPDKSGWLMDWEFVKTGFIR
jgi:hypothetical protein